MQEEIDIRRIDSVEDLEVSLATLRHLSRIHEQLMALVRRPPEPPSASRFPHPAEERVVWNYPGYVSPVHAVALYRLRRQIRHAISELAERLNTRWPTAPIFGDFSFGQFDRHVKRQPFLRGHIDLLQRRPVVRRLPDKVLFCLMTIDGLSDQLVRENHGNWGYHYHYIDSKFRRSDTLLTFERQQSPDGPVLTWERHAEGDKFKAKANAWGLKKRASVYTTCLPDTKRWALSVFKMPDSSALPVWP